MNDRVQYWLESAKYDMDTAKAMLATGRYLYVGFTCHLCIEKTMKAVWANNSDEMPPRIHNLIQLAIETRIWEQMSTAQQRLLTALNPLYLESRYPSSAGGIQAALTESLCATLVKETEGCMQWIQAKL